MATEVRGGRVEPECTEWLLVSKVPTLAHGSTVAKEAEPGMAAHHAERPVELPGLHNGCGSPALHPAPTLTFRGSSHLNQTPGKIYS